MGNLFIFSAIIMTILDCVIAVPPVFTAECCCSLQDCVRSGWAQTRALPDHAHHQGEERPRKPQTAAYDGDRYTHSLYIINCHWRLRLCVSDKYGLL